MLLVDIVLLVIIFGFVYKGIKDGFIDTICSLIAVVVGLNVANWSNGPASSWLMKLTGWGMTFSRVLMFIVIFIAVNRLVSWLLALLQKVLDTIARLPVIKSLNKVLGGVCGAIIGIIFCAVIIYLFRRFSHGIVVNAFNHSTIAGYITQAMNIIAPFLSRVILSF